jgi:hypothetical protein
LPVGELEYKVTESPMQTVIEGLVLVIVGLAGYGFRFIIMILDQPLQPLGEISSNLIVSLNFGTYVMDPPPGYKVSLTYHFLTPVAVVVIVMASPIQILGLVVEIVGVGRGFTITFLIILSFSGPKVATNFTGYVPALGKVKVGLTAVLVPRLAKSHRYVGVPHDAIVELVNVVGRFAQTVSAVKFAVGAPMLAKRIIACGLSVEVVVVGTPHWLLTSERTNLIPLAELNTLI